MFDVVFFLFKVFFSVASTWWAMFLSVLPQRSAEKTFFSSLMGCSHRGSLVPFVGFSDYAEAWIQLIINFPDSQTLHLPECGCLWRLLCWAPEPSKVCLGKQGWRWFEDGLLARDVHFNKATTTLEFDLNDLTHSLLIEKQHWFLIHTKCIFLHVVHLQYWHH